MAFNESNTTKIENQIYFEVRGGEAIKSAAKAIEKDFKEIKARADAAEKSMQRTIKAWSTLAQMPPMFKNISTAVYDKKSQGYNMQWAKNTHATELYTNHNRAEKEDYSGLRTEWAWSQRQIQIEAKKQLEIDKQISTVKQNTLHSLEQGFVLFKQIQAEGQKELNAAKKSARNSQLTANQKEKYHQQEMRTNASMARTQEMAAQRESRDRERNRPYNKFKDEHPELFARGGQYFDIKHQAAGTLSSIGSRLSRLGAGGRVVGDILDSLGAFVRSPIAGTATALTKLVSGVIDLGVAATKAYSEIESIKTQLGVVFSNQTQADDMFGQISQYAVKSPFGVQQTSELAVLLKQSGVYASDLMDTLKMLGDTAGGNMEKMKRIANNYAQIVSIGKASMLDMRQFAYAGIPIFEAVSKELGVSQQELRKMISDGKVTSDIIAKVFKDLTGINGIFENATEKGAKTLKARLQNLQDAKQLAMSSLGERFVNAGSVTGRDSTVYNILAATENFYQWMREHNDIKNIERDVNLIANNNSKLASLSKALEIAQNMGDKDLIRLIKEEIEVQKNIFGYDQQRLVYSNSYDIKTDTLKRFQEQYGEMTLEEVGAKYSEVRNKKVELEQKLENESLSLTKEENEQLQYQIDIYTRLVEELESYRAAIKKSKTITEEEIKANREKTLIDEQQGAFDRANSYSDATTSLMTSFQELNEIYKASDEYKEKKEAERQKTLEEALVVLKEISKHTDEKGTVDITKLGGAKKFNELIEKGALTASKKLDIVNSDKKYSKEERSRLMTQYGGFQTELETILKDKKYKAFFTDKDIYDLAVNNIKTLARDSDEEFYNNFSKLDKDTNEYLSTLIDKYTKKRKAGYDKLPASAQKKADEDIKNFEEFIETYRTALLYSLNEYQTQTGGEEVSASMLNKGKNEFIPLWKRIFASNTGLSTQGMETPTRTLNTYLDEVAPRKMVANVMKATLSTLGIDAATKLLKPSESLMELQGTQGSGRYIHQIDWKKSSEALKDFTMRLSASTEVISAYRQSLEEERDVIRNLIVQGATEMESQDLSKQKLVSVKTLQKLSASGIMSADSQLVNALGNKLETLDGLAVSIQDGKFIDENGLEVSEENLKVTDDIFDILKKHLPRIEQELSEASARELNNKTFADLLNKTLPKELAKLVNDSLTPLRRSTSGYLIDNQDSYLINQFYNLFSGVQEQYKHIKGYEDIAFASREDIITTALMKDSETYKAGVYAERTDKALEIVQAVLDKVIEMTGSLGVGLNSSNLASPFQILSNLALTAERDAAAMDAYRKMFGYQKQSQLSPSARPDEGGYDLGSRVLSKFFGYESKYAKEDIYETFKKDYGISSELEDATKKWLDMQMAIYQTKEIMKGLSDETAKFTGQLAEKAFLTPFQTSGEYLAKTWTKSLKDGEKWTELTADAMADLGKEAVSALGPIMAKAGFELVARGAILDNWGMILGGLGLAATGGFATGLGSALSNSQKDKNDKESEKIQALKDQLADLLEQARKDAIYYEKNMRHKTALGINKEFSVNDAIITPKGDVVTTDPKDYLIATKTPGQFAGGNVTVQPIINNQIINNTSSKVRQEQTQNADGSINLITIIEDAVGEYIASARSDDAFTTRDYRIRGKQSIM